MRRKPKPSKPLKIAAPRTESPASISGGIMHTLADMEGRLDSLIDGIQGLVRKVDDDSDELALPGRDAFVIDSLASIIRREYEEALTLARAGLLKLSEPKGEAVA